MLIAHIITLAHVRFLHIWAYFLVLYARIVAGDRYNYLQIRYADIHADISADIYLHNFVHIGISADIPSICRYGTLSADIALYLQIWYVLQIY